MLVRLYLLLRISRPSSSQAEGERAGGSSSANPHFSFGFLTHGIVSNGLVYLVRTELRQQGDDGARQGGAGVGVSSQLHQAPHTLAGHYLTRGQQLVTFKARHLLRERAHTHIQASSTKPTNVHNVTSVLVVMTISIPLELADVFHAK